MPLARVTPPRTPDAWPFRPLSDAEVQDALVAGFGPSPLRLLGGMGLAGLARAVKPLTPTERTLAELVERREAMRRTLPAQERTPPPVPPRSPRPASPKAPPLDPPEPSTRVPRGQQLSEALQTLGGVDEPTARSLTETIRHTAGRVSRPPGRVSAQTADISLRGRPAERLVSREDLEDAALAKMSDIVETWRTSGSAAPISRAAREPIKQAIYAEQGKAYPSSLSREGIRNLSRINRIIDRTRDLTGRLRGAETPSAESIARLMQKFHRVRISPQEVNQLRGYAEPPLRGVSGIKAIDDLASLWQREGMEKPSAELIDRVEAALAQIAGRGPQVLARRYGLGEHAPMGLQDTAKALGITEQSALRDIARTIAQLKQIMGAP